MTLPADRPSPPSQPSWSLRLVSVAAVLTTAAVRLRLAGVPLERDEGEYAYMGQLILRGEVPYLAAHNMKLPGTYYAYAAILAGLGETDVGIRIALLGLNLATIGLVYLLGRRLGGRTVALVAAATYGVLSLGSEVLGFTANAEHFVLVPALAGAVVLAGCAPDARPIRFAAAGVLLGTGFVMKQPGAAFMVFGVIVAFLAGRPAGLRRAATTAAAFAVGSLLPYALVCTFMWQAGAFSAFWFWTITYAAEYVSMIPVEQGLAELLRVGVRILASAPLVWGLALVGSVALAVDRGTRGARRFLVPFGVCSVLAVCPGLRFTEHYFLLVLPAVALAAGLGIATIDRRLPRATAVTAFIAAAAFAQAGWSDRRVFFELPLREVARAVYGVNPFPEAPDIARRLAAMTAPDEPIAVIGSEPEIYFYARRRAATTYIYMYPLMEPHPFAGRMQAEMIAQLEAARPRFLVLVNVSTSWTMRPDSSHAILDWAARTANADYAPIGTIEIARGVASVPRWGGAAATPPASPTHVVVFERRT